MDKKNVVSILQDSKQDQRNKFNMLLMALNQAPHKNLSLTAHYNRSGYSDKNLRAIEYDVKKAFSISSSDMRKFEKTETKEVEELEETEEVPQKPEPDAPPVDPDGKMKLEELNEQLSNTNTEEASYHDMTALAFDLAEQLNIELPNKKKSTIVAFLDEQKKSLGKKA